MKRIVLFLLIGGFIASNLYQSNQQTKKNISEQSSNIEEVNGIPTKEKTTTSQVNDHHFLFLSLDKGKVKKVLVTKMNNESQSIEVASLSKENIKLCMDDKQTWIKDISKDEKYIDEMGKSLGIPIDNIIVLEKQGFSTIFTKIFPNGLPLKLTEEMKRDIQVDENSGIYYVDSNQFVETMKALKHYPKYDEEIQKMVMEAFYSQLSKPEIFLSMFNTISNSKNYFFTDLTITDLFSLGVRVMKNPIKDVQTFDMPVEHDEKVIKKVPVEWNSF